MHIINRKRESNSQLMAKNFGITEAQFNQLVKEAVDGNCILLKFIFDNHFEVCVNYLVNFLNVNPEDAMDASMDALLDFWSKILQAKIRYGNLSFLLTKMAFQSFVKAKNIEKKLDYRCIFSTEIADVDAHCAECILVAFDGLRGTEKELLANYYIDDLSMVEIARLNSMSEVTVRKRKQRAVAAFKIEFFKRFDPEN
jgi:DNA-directed RNA polymerase specialized sigma24 family protein